MTRKFNIIIACSDEQNDLYSVNLSSWMLDEDGNRVNLPSVRKSGLTCQQAQEELNRYLTNT